VTARRRAEGGFTLLEVIVAMALFAAGIVVVFRLYSGALRLAAGSRDASASSIYARQRMEEALLVPDPVEGVERGTFGDRYRWEVTTSVVPQEEEKPYDEIHIRVAVSWLDGSDERAVDLSANRWRRRDKGAGGLPAGPALTPWSFTSESGGLPVAQGGGLPVAQGGGLPVTQGGGLPVMQGGGTEPDYLGAPVRRRLR
jgi:general secretion pathway protein I